MRPTVESGIAMPAIRERPPVAMPIARPFASTTAPPEEPG